MKMPLFAVAFSLFVMEMNTPGAEVVANDPGSVAARSESGGRNNWARAGKPATASPGVDGSGSTDSAVEASMPPGYLLAAASEAGKRLVAHKEAVTTVKAALETALKDLSVHFDAKPAARGAFTDARNQRWGGAPFEAKLKGRPIKGLVLCSVGEHGTDLAVAYCRADAPASEWAKRGAGHPGVADRTRGKMTEYRFPDGTGSIQLPEGWKTSARTAIQGVPIEGPAGQLVTIGQSISINTPDSIAVQTQLQLQAQARQMGFPPPPGVDLLVAPFAEPAETVKLLIPQLSHIGQRKGGPALRLERFLEPPKPAAPMMPNGKAASLYFAITRTVADKATLYRARADIENWVIGPGAWTMTYTEVAAPDATFDEDLPVMGAIVKSLKTDPGALRRETGRAIQAMNQRFAVYQQARATRAKAFDDYFQSQQRNSIIRDRAAVDFDEVIRGVRTVENTRTGERHSVDLGNVNEIVEELNRPEAGRFVQIPLRNE
jgi:hypothetical protein